MSKDHDNEPRRRPRRGRRSTTFLEQRALARTGDRPGARGRLIFALDATMSRQPTWDTACALQADMFREAARDRRARHPARLFPRA